MHMPPASRSSSRPTRNFAGLPYFECFGRALTYGDVDRARTDVDAERARKESPFGGPIAHGFLTQSLVPAPVSEARCVPNDAKGVKATLEARGKNLAPGFHQRHDGGLPSMVDKSKPEVGGNLGATPGKVDYAEEHVGLNKYAPRTAQVWSPQVFIVPQQISEFYVWYFAQGRSIGDHPLSEGYQVLNWRNPTAAEAD